MPLPPRHRTRVRAHPTRVRKVLCRKAICQPTAIRQGITIRQQIAIRQPTVIRRGTAIPHRTLRGRKAIREGRKAEVEPRLRMMSERK
jgi:hypothetical protein